MRCRHIVLTLLFIAATAQFARAQCSLDHFLLGQQNGQLFTDDWQAYRHCTLDGSNPYSLDHYALSYSVFGFWTRGEPGFGALTDPQYQLQGEPETDYNIHVERVFATDGLVLLDDGFNSILEHDGDTFSLTERSNHSHHFHLRFIVYEDETDPYEACFRFTDSLGMYETSQPFSVWMGARPVPGDANGDGCIDGADLAIWQQNYDPLSVNGNAFSMGDFNYDAGIDGADLAIWQQNYNPLGAGAAAVIPEPGTLGLVALASLLPALKRANRRRR